MGFYSASSIVRDAQAHGVEIFEPSVVHSDWDCILVGPAERPSVRLGLRMIRGLGEPVGRAIEQARGQASFRDLDDLIRRTELRKNVVEALAEAGALEEIVQGRRNALWRARAPRAGPLFEQHPVQESEIELPPLRPAEQLVLDYARVGLSVHDHPLRHLRAGLDRRRVLRTEELPGITSGKRIAVAGVVLNRQAPMTASGVVFMTIEDETGTANVILWKNVFEGYRHTAVNAKLLLVEGKVETREGTTHVLASRLERLDTPRQAEEAPLGGLRARSRDFC